jgi:hypothetical protein
MRGIVFKTIFVVVVERDFFGDFFRGEGKGYRHFSHLILNFSPKILHQFLNKKEKDNYTTR